LALKHTLTSGFAPQTFFGNRWRNSGFCLCLVWSEHNIHICPKAFHSHAKDEKAHCYLKGLQDGDVGLDIAELRGPPEEGEEVETKELG